MKTRHFLSLMAGLSLGVIAPAQQVLTYFAEIPAATTDWTGTLHLTDFNPALGTLTQVKLTYSGAIAQSVFAENLDGPDQSYDLLTTATLSLARAGGPTLIASGPVNLEKTGMLAVFDGTIDFAGPSGVFFSQNTNYGGVYIDPSLADYVGTGTVDFNASALASSVLTMHGGNAADGASTTAGSSLTIEYTYSPIPEPATYAALLGLAALGLAIHRRPGLRAAKFSTESAEDVAL